MQNTLVDDEEESGKPAVSLSPKGLTEDIYRVRLDSLTDPTAVSKDAEHIIAQMWAKENTRDNNINLGGVPIDKILHRCNSKCKGGADHVEGGHAHYYTGEFDEEEVKIAAATVQFLATNVGRGFYNEFLKCYEAANATTAE